MNSSSKTSVTSRFMCRRLMAALGRAYYFCMGFRVVVKGKQVSSSEAPILAVAPHSTFFDGIVCIVAGLPSTVSRVENLATPIFGRETLFWGMCTWLVGPLLSSQPLECVCLCVKLVSSCFRFIWVQFHILFVDLFDNLRQCVFCCKIIILCYQ